MKICIFTHTIPRFQGDTAAPFMDSLAEALSSLGHEVFSLVPFDEKINLKTKRKFNLIAYKYIYPDNLHILGYGRTLSDDREMKLAAYILSPLFYFFSFLALLALVKKEKINVISSHWIIPGGFIAALVSKLTKVPFTTTIPGSDIYMAGKNWLFKWMAGVAAKNAKFVLSDSPHYLKKLNLLGLNPKNAKVVRYGVNTKSFKPEKKDRNLLGKLDIDGNDQVILGVGRLVSKKGFIYLLNAFPEVLVKFPKAKLVIVGDGDQRKHLEDRVKEMGLGRKVVFTGMVPFNYLQKYYNLADVLVAPSIEDKSGNIDASPVSMMEAMACGVPVVATKFSGSENLVVDGKTGYLVPSSNSKKIAWAVAKILSLAKNRNFKSQVRRIIQNRFSSKKTALKYEKMFKEIVSYS